MVQYVVAERHPSESHPGRGASFSSRGYYRALRHGIPVAVHGPTARKKLLSINTYFNLAYKVDKHNELKIMINEISELDDIENLIKAFRTTECFTESVSEIMRKLLGK